MKLLVLASSSRTLNNFFSVLELMHARGDQIDLVWMPLGTQIKIPESPVFHNKIVAPIAPVAGLRLDNPFYEEIRKLVTQSAYDAILMDDMNHWPSQRLSAAIRRLKNRPVIFAFQHGLRQLWNVMNENFCADYFLCFGRRHVLNFDQKFWPRVFPCGLPKLDKLKDVDVYDGGSALYFAQSSPNPRIIISLIQDLQTSTGKKVRLRPHPKQPHAYSEPITDLELVSVQEDPLKSLASCSWLLTMHSTAVLEALYLGKVAVILPSFGLTDFTFYPAISTEFLSSKVLYALRKFHTDAYGVARFLQQTCGGIRFDSTLRAVGIIDSILESGIKIKEDLVSWPPPTMVVELIKQDHPLV